MIRRTLVALAVTVAMAASVAPATAAVKPVDPPPKAKWQKVDSTLFGMHVASVSAGKKFPGRLGGVRLWDNGVRWDQIETSRGEFDWERLDTAVRTAEESGAREISYILGSTPEWAAKYVRPDKYYYGGGTASEPKKLTYWREWVRAVATRYKGRITSYQIWNEANLASFYAPERPKHWKRMALLTDIAADEIRAIDRKAKIVSASSTVIQGKKFTTESFFFRYLRSIRNRKVKLDAIAVHLYPWTTKGPGGGTPTERLEGLTLAREVTYAPRLLEGAHVGYRGQLRQPPRQRPRHRGLQAEGGCRVPRPDLRGQPAIRRHQGLLVLLGVPRDGHQHDRRDHRGAGGTRPGVLHDPGLAGGREVGDLLRPTGDRVLVEAQG